MIHMPSQFHILYFEIDGLNLGDEIFNHDDKLFFAHPKGADDNISNAFVVLDGPLIIETGGKAWESPENNKSAQNHEKALRLVGIFLACHSLANKNHHTKIVFKSASGYSLQTRSDIISLVKTGGGYHNNIKSDKRKFSVEDTITSLDNTKSIFNKVMTILDSLKKETNTLLISLLTYQKSVQRGDMLQEFLGLVTSLESLLCGRGNLRYKFALRTSVFIEPDKSKRKELYKKLQHIYDLRNDLVHGNKISMYPYRDHWEYKIELIPIVEKALNNYIELAHNKNSNEDILQHIDEILLGIR